MQKIYSFWNGKNLDGRQDYLEVGREPDCARRVDSGASKAAKRLMPTTYEE